MVINTQKVLVGGVAAGIVAFALDFVLNGLLLSGAWEAAVSALNPGLVDGMDSPRAIAGVAVIDLLWGVALVCLYAWIRPRFGAGAGTAFKAGLMAWAIAAIAFSSQAVIGIFSWGMFVVGALAWLVVSVIAAEVGAWLYAEEAPAPSPGAGTEALAG